MSTVSTVNGGISFWYADRGTPTPREPLPGDSTADVCIVGGGYTGLWTAYYLKKAVPFLNITVLEAKFCGYGASGRNGGWLYNGIAGRDRYAKLHGHDAAVRLQQAMNDTVDEVIRVAAEEKIDADIHRGGVLEVAYTPAQLARLKDFHSVEIAFGETDRTLHGARETSERIRVNGAVGSTWTPHGARLHPAKLVTGLADTVEALGVTIHESTPVTEIRPKHAVTPYGTVRAPYVLRCTEGFTANLKGQKRTWLPMNSSMIITEPLPASVWDTIGWEGRETLGDMAHARPAHRRRPHRPGRPRLPVPLRLRHRQRRPHPARDHRGPARTPHPPLPHHRRHPDRPRLVRRPRRPPRLVRDRHPRPLHRPRLGRRLRRLGRRHHQPRRPHPARPHPAGLRPVRPHRTDRPPLGQPPRPPLGTRTPALARRPRHVRRLPRRRPQGTHLPAPRHRPHREDRGPAVGAGVSGFGHKKIPGQQGTDLGF